MDLRTCSICGVEKAETREFFYFRKDSNTFRKECKECAKNVKIRKNIKSPTKWDYERTKALFLKHNLTPLFEEFEGIVKAKEKLTAINKEGYKIQACIDKLKTRGDNPSAFSVFNPYTIENIRKYLRAEGKGFQLLSSEYRGNSPKLKWKCRNDHTFEIAWSDFSFGKRCAKCSGVYKRTNEEFSEEVFDAVGIEYTFCEEFKGVDTKIKVVHNVCGYNYKVTPYKFINVGRRCPKCNESKGERRVRDFLISNNIRYKEEYSFDDCRLKLPLRFDFAVFDKLNNLVSLIEYDGRQHFEPSKYYGGEEYYEKNKIRDAIKNDYCKKNNINLLRIPYTEFENIEKILAAHL